LASIGNVPVALGQIIPFEVVIQASGGTGPERGTVDFTAAWNTYTTSNNRFGYDTNYMVYCAFVDAADPGFIDPNNNARVESYSSGVINPGTISEAIQGTFRVSGIDSGDRVVVEIWVVLMSTMPDHTGGTVAATLVSAQTAAVPPVPITVGVQTDSLGNLSKIGALPPPQQQPPLGPLPPQPPVLPGATINVINRTWTARDDCGNQSTCVQQITVRDTTPPAVTVKDFVLECPATDTSTNAIDVPVIQDVCGSVRVSYSDIVSNSCGNSKVIFRTWTATDESGNSTNVLQRITVQDTTPPVVTAPANLTLACTDSLNPSLNPALGVATALDNCGGTSTPTYTDQIIPGNCAGNYSVKRTWSSTDACGNTGTALQTLTIQDTTAPTLVAPPNLVLAFTANTSTNVTGVATATDACDSVSLSYSDSARVLSDGSQVITRTWSATDACGNSVSAVQSITLQPPTGLILPAQSNLWVNELTTLVVTNTATNLNVPSNPLAYQLINPPAGATIDSNGIITWTPTLGQSPSTNLFTTVVTTTLSTPYGTSTLSATNSFVVIVSGPYDGLDLLADTDGDGLTNLVEYAVGSDPVNPTDANARILIYITQDGGNHYLTMKFSRRANAAALHLQYLPEVSADKLTWFSDASHVLGLSVSPLDAQFDWVTVRDTTPITTAQARFIRLHVVSATQESFSPVWIGSDTLLQGNNLSLFSQRMVRPILSAGTVSSLNSTTITDTNTTFVAGEFGSNSMPAYVEFDNGTMMDIANTTPSSLALASGTAAPASVGQAYRIRAHFTVASLFGTNNETGLFAGPNPAQADNIMLVIPQTQQTLTLFYYSNPSFTSWQGWVRADSFTPAPNQVVYPEQGVMVRRIVPSPAHIYLCGPIKVGTAVVPLQRGYNLLGTLKSLSSVALANLNLFTGNANTGVIGGLNPSQADNLIVVNPNGSVTTYFYYNNPSVYQGWVNANGFSLSGATLIPPGSAFFINRQTSGGFNWTIPAE
jgi:hypothetical protein